MDEYGEKTEEEYDKERELIDEMFHHANFTVGIEMEDLDEVITDKKAIVIKSTYTCWCYDNRKRKTDYFMVIGECITNKYVLNSLIEQGLNLDCDHNFIEGFVPIKNSDPNADCRFEIMTGS